MKAKGKIKKSCLNCSYTRIYKNQFATLCDGIEYDSELESEETFEPCDNYKNVNVEGELYS